MLKHNFCLFALSDSLRKLRDPLLVGWRLRKSYRNVSHGNLEQEAFSPQASVSPYKK